MEKMISKKYENFTKKNEKMKISKKNENVNNKKMLNENLKKKKEKFENCDF